MCAAWDLGLDIRWLESVGRDDRVTPEQVTKLARKRDDLVRIITDHAPDLSEADLQRICSLPEERTVSYTVHDWLFDEPGAAITPYNYQRTVTWSLQPLQQLAKQELERRRARSP